MLPVTQFTASKLAKDSEKNRKRLHASGLTAKQRSLQSKNEDFYEEGGKLYCRPCCKIIDHTRQGSIERHKETQGHLTNKKARKIQKTLNSTLPIATSARFENVAVIEDWVRASCAANIPFHKTDNGQLRDFFREHIRGGGAIPKARALSPYLKDCYLADRMKLKQYLASHNLIVYFDETFDSLGRFVSCVLLAAFKNETSSLLPILAETYFQTEPLNHNKVSQQIIKTLGNYEVELDRIVALCSDNASYMKKSYTAALKTLLPNCQHLTCLCHILNLVMKSFMEKFTLSLTFCHRMTEYFNRPSARRYRYLQFLEDTGMRKKMPPVANATRWTSTFDAVVYYEEHLPVVKSFLLLEVDDFEGGSLLELQTFL